MSLMTPHDLIHTQAPSTGPLGAVSAPGPAGIAIGAGLGMGFGGVDELGVKILAPVFLMESCP